MNRKKQIIKYLVFDICAIILSWFYVNYYNLFDFHFLTKNTYFGYLIIIIYWLILHYFVGFYNEIYPKSRLKELSLTFTTIIIGNILLFIVTFFQKNITNQNLFYSFTIYGLILFLVTYIPRLIITSITIYKFRNRIIGINTILVGSNGKATKLYFDFESKPKSTGNKFVGFVSLDGNNHGQLVKYLPYLGIIDKLPEIIKQYKAEEIIVALETIEQQEIQKIINKIQNINIPVKVLPSVFDIYTGLVKVPAMYDIPLITISVRQMPVWQRHVKRLIDVLFSLFALIIFFPVFLFAAIGVRLSSKGAIIFKQERIGKNGKPFVMYKFRSMFIDAERNGPELSSLSDKRVTPFGRFMRKTRLDEIPQFVNVFIGNMSLVGPRPERLFYINQIVEKAPHYFLLQRVKPGITSWGQVKFGYAENVDEMIERLKYDILYIQDMSIYTDLKILIYTIRIVLNCRGK